MQRVLDWLLERRIAVIIIAIVFAPNIALISSSVIALQWAHRGAAVAVGDALIAMLAISVIAMAAAGGPANAMPLAIEGCLSIAIGCFIGAIVRAAGNLTLAVQVLLLTGFIGIVLYTFFGSTSNTLFDAQMNQILDVLRQQQRSQAEIAEVAALQPRLVGIYGLDICLRMLFTALLAFWALGYARRRPDFGREFRALRVGYVLGVPSAVILAAALAFDFTLLHNLFGVAALVFVLHGLARLHARGHAAGWHALHYVPIYLIGVLTVSYLLIVGIFGEGLA